MLVLSRKCDQAVIIGGAENLANTLKVTVIEIHGGSVRLGFEADKGVPVHREEVWQRIRDNARSEPPMPRLASPAERSGRREDDGEGSQHRTGALAGCVAVPQVAFSPA